AAILSPPPPPLHRRACSLRAPRGPASNRYASFVSPSAGLGVAYHRSVPESLRGALQTGGRKPLGFSQGMNGPSPTGNGCPSGIAVPARLREHAARGTR